MDLGLAGKVARRHRLEPRDRARHRDAARRGRARTSSSLRAGPRHSRRRSPRRRGPGRAHGVVADVTTADGRDRVVEAAVAAFGGLDIVVNNVGGSGARTFDELDAADLEDVLGGTSFPALEVSRAAVPALRERGGGVIAMIASIWGREGGGEPELQRRQGGGDQPREGDGARPRQGPDPRVQRRARLDAVPRRELGAAAARGSRADRGVRRARAAVGAVRHASTRSPTSSRSSSRERASWVVGTCVTVDGGQSRSF